MSKIKSGTKTIVHINVNLLDIDYFPSLRKYMTQ